MNKILTSVLVISTLLSPLTAFAAGKGNPTHLKNHPRVNQVNQRIQNQRARIAQGVKSGEISKAQDRQLHAERHAIKQEEHTMRQMDNGHLTRADQKVLNQQLNERSQDIYSEKH